MAGFDKYLLGEKLKAAGWEEVSGEQIDTETAFIPPDSLWAGKPPVFSVYEARDLQCLLGKPMDEEAA